MVTGQPKCGDTAGQSFPEHTVCFLHLLERQEYLLNLPWPRVAPSTTISNLHEALCTAQSRSPGVRNAGVAWYQGLPSKALYRPYSLQV
jgi:hypothetical protein